ncbi:MAG: DUF2975 domain-containing protein [Oscillospiraceae bacterium]|jgi:hypothetical protein|nr:DUF2975 domain-containing protein [Oscillospiraceae bacterium]
MMSPKTLCRLLRLAVIASGICALFIMLIAIPSFGKMLVWWEPYVVGWYTPWLIFAWVAALPCFAILVLIWRVSGAVKNDTVFTVKTARLIKAGSVLLFIDVGFFFVGNIVLFLFGMSHPFVLLISAIVDIFAIALALLAAVLARYITKAAALQVMSEGII